MLIRPPGAGAPTPRWRSCGPCWRAGPSTATASSSGSGGREDPTRSRSAGADGGRGPQRCRPGASRPAGRRLAGRVVLAPPVRADGVARVEEIGAGRDVAWQHGLQLWLGVGASPAEGRSHVAETMERFYRMSFEPFERYTPCGTAADIAGFLQPYVDAGAGALNLTPCGPDRATEIETVAEVKTATEPLSEPLQSKSPAVWRDYSPRGPEVRQGEACFNPGRGGRRLGRRRRSRPT